MIRLSSGGPLATRVNGCVIVGLQSRPELNGRRCAVVEYDATRGRYKAYLDADKPPDLLPDGNMVSYTGPRFHPATHHGEGLMLKPANVVLPVGARVVVLVGAFREREGRIVSSLVREGSKKPTAHDYLVNFVPEMHDGLAREFAALGIPVAEMPLGRHETTAVEEDAGYDIEFRDHDSTGPPITHTFVDPNAPDAPSRVGDWAVADVFGVENKEHKGGQGIWCRTGLVAVNESATRRWARTIPRTWDPGGGIRTAAACCCAACRARRASSPSGRRRHGRRSECLCVTMKILMYTERLTPPSARPQRARRRAPQARTALRA